MKLFLMVIKKWRKEWLNGKSEGWDLLKPCVCMFLAIVKNKIIRREHYYGKKALFHKHLI